MSAADDVDVALLVFIDDDVVVMRTFAIIQSPSNFITRRYLLKLRISLLDGNTVLGEKF